MKQLFLLRGLPGSGKSTWIEKNGFSAYTLSSDKLREMYAGLEYDTNGNLVISAKCDKLVWNTLFSMLETRMNRGLTTFVDATHIKESSINKYKKLANLYGYKIYIIDFTFVPIETCLIRNKNRGYKFVPETAIYRMANNLEKSKIPNDITVLSLAEFINMIIGVNAEISAEKYNKITFIGDIHGCLKTVQELFKMGIDNKTLYVFTGDYIDRGPHSVETVLFLAALSKRENFIFLEGNHERWLRDWMVGNETDIRSKDFLNTTRLQFEKHFERMKNEKKTYELKQIKKFVDSLREFALIKLPQKDSDQYIFACHGGVPYVNPTVCLMSGSDIIRGVGSYEDSDRIDAEFDKKLNGQLYLVHGHRNIHHSPIQVNESAFNLEGSIERGGCLRIVTFFLNNCHTNGCKIEVKEIKNKEDLK